MGHTAMGLPATAEDCDDGKTIERAVLGKESYNSQNMKLEGNGATGDRSSQYDPESPPTSDGSHAGDTFDDEKELAQHPDSITEGAQLGQQKAEAAALAWSWPALVGIYAW
jgi:hypothetical protein